MLFCFLGFHFILVTAANGRLTVGEPQQLGSSTITSSAVAISTAE